MDSKCADGSGCPELPDTQAQEDTRGITLDRVGIEEISFPFRLSAGTTWTDAIQAKVSMYSVLQARVKGANMSRFLEVLMSLREGELDVMLLYTLLRKLQDSLKSQDVYVRVDFWRFLLKEAPVTKKQAVQGYQCALAGHLLNGSGIAKAKEQKFGYYIEVNVPVMTMCPCSKAMSERGAHGQRAWICLRVKPTEQVPQGPFKLDHWIALAENAGSCPVYPLLKRPDEKWVTDRAYENPKFVEDVARDVVVALRKEKVVGYHVRVVSKESIHPHQAICSLKHNWDF